MNRILQPPGWMAPKGFSNGMVARGRQVYVAGQIGWDEQCVIHSDVLAVQVEQALRNILAVLAEADGKPEHLVRLTWYVTSREEYLAQLREIGSAYRRVLGTHFPAMALVQVVALVEVRAKVEIEATAVIPDTG